MDWWSVLWSRDSKLDLTLRDKHERDTLIFPSWMKDGTRCNYAERGFNNMYS